MRSFAVMQSFPGSLAGVRYAAEREARVQASTQGISSSAGPIAPVMAAHPSLERARE